MLDPFASEGLAVFILDKPVSDPTRLAAALCVEDVCFVRRGMEDSRARGVEAFSVSLSGSDSRVKFTDSVDVSASLDTHASSSSSESTLIVKPPLSLDPLALFVAAVVEGGWRFDGGPVWCSRSLASTRTALFVRGRGEAVLACS